MAKSFTIFFHLEAFSPLAVIYYSDDPDEQLETLNTLISECLERQPPLRKVRVTRPSAPWMKDPLIEELQKKRGSVRFTAHQTSTDAARHEFHSVRNRLRSAIRTARKTFIEKALYSNKSREVWKVIHRVLKPSARPLRFDPDELNDFFATTAQRTQETRATPTEDLTCLIDNLPDVPSGSMRFQLSPVTSEDVLQVIKNLRSDCSTGADQIPTRFIKMVVECLAVPLASIINIALRKLIFQSNGRLLGCLQFQRLTTRSLTINFGPSQFSLCYPRSSRSLWLFKWRIMRTTPIFFTIASLLSVKGIPPLQPCWELETIFAMPWKGKRSRLWC